MSRFDAAVPITYNLCIPADGSMHSLESYVSMADDPVKRSVEIPPTWPEKQEYGLVFDEEEFMQLLSASPSQQSA